MQRHVSTPAEYLQDVPASQRPLLDHLRQMIQQAAPKLTERINYGMLVFGDEAGDVFAIAAQKHYVGLYVSTQAVAALQDELAEIDHGKCCLRFKRLDQVPAALVRKLLKLSLAGRQETLPKEAKAKPIAARSKGAKAPKGNAKKAIPKRKK